MNLGMLLTRTFMGGRKFVCHEESLRVCDLHQASFYRLNCTLAHTRDVIKKAKRPIAVLDRIFSEFKASD